MIIVSMNACCDDENQAAKVAEVFSRVLIGVALEGIMISLNLQKMDNNTAVGSDEEIGPS